MGLDLNAARFLMGEKARGVAFGRTLTLGRQGIYMENTDYMRILRSLHTAPSEEPYADNFYTALGATSLEAMDASAYEGAHIVHDINEPISQHLHNSFDTIIDGGTLEHVFNFPVSIKNCMEMVKPGGHLILLTPWHNYSGHGFYQFSPELLYNTLSEENGFKVERMLIAVDGYWYAVKEPRQLERRVEIVTSNQILLHVTAKKLDCPNIFQSWPQQSDYDSAWQRGSYAVQSDIAPTGLKETMVQKIAPIRILQKQWRHYKSQRLLSPSKNPGMVRICKSDEIPG